MKRIIERVKLVIKMANSFGLKITALHVITLLYRYSCHPNCVAWVFNNLKHNAILNYLEKKYSMVLYRYINMDQTDAVSYSKKENTYNNIIWTCWWQGGEMPGIISLCIDRIKKMSNSHQVIIIDKYNYKKYIELPDYIIEKVNSKIISFTHLSDILRMFLIYHYGGLWLDSTIYPVRKISDSIFEWKYYTGKMNPIRIECISQGRWAGFLLAGQAGNTYCHYMLDFFYKYWKEENMLIEYFLIDYITEIAYQNISEYRNMLNSIPINNVSILEFDRLSNYKYDKNKLNELLEENDFFKLRRCKEHFARDDKGNLTFYGYVLFNYK